MCPLSPNKAVFHKVTATAREVPEKASVTDRLADAQSYRETLNLYSTAPYSQQISIIHYSTHHLD